MVKICYLVHKSGKVQKFQTMSLSAESPKCHASNEPETATYGWFLAKLYHEKCVFRAMPIYGKIGFLAQKSHRIKNIGKSSLLTKSPYHNASIEP